MLKATLITLSVVGLLAAGGYAWARHGADCPGGSRAERVAERVAGKLDLNQAQRDKLDALVGVMQQARRDARAQRTGMREALKALLADGSFDRERALGLLDETGQAVAAHKQALVDAFAAFSDSLSPEQRGRLAELVDRRMGRGWGHRHGHGF